MKQADKAVNTNSNFAARNEEVNELQRAVEEKIAKVLGVPVEQISKEVHPEIGVGESADGELKQRENKIIKPIEIKKGIVPKFGDTKDLKNWILENLNILGDITIKDNGRIVSVGKTGFKRSLKGIKRSEAKRESYQEFKGIIENAIEYKPKPNDEKHPDVLGQEIYHNLIVYDNKPFGVEISVDIPKIKNAQYNYAGHKIKEIKIEPAVTGVASDEALPYATGSNISINDIRKLFNPTEYTQTSKVNNINEKSDLTNVNNITDSELDDIAKSYFGTTTNLKEAGYILNDGSLLDLSGKNMGGMAGRRSLNIQTII